MSLDLASKLARLVVQYSVDVQKGETVVIAGSTEAIPLMNELYREVLRAGGHPFTKIDVPGQRYIFMNEARDHQLEYENPFDLNLAQKVDVAIRVASETNTRELSNIAPERMRAAKEAQTNLLLTFMQRGATGELKWCAVPWTTSAIAQEAGMSAEEFSALVEKACMLDRPDPAAEWKKVSEEQQKICDFLGSADELRIVGEGTDLTMSTKARKWINCDGHLNLPDGEVFTAPVEDSVNGTVSFSYPAIVDAREVDGIVLTFKDGVVEEYSAAKGEEYLAQTLEIDGAKRLGEIGIGTNYGHQTFVKKILFDEKMGGTIHLALGAGYPESGSQNVSAVHWDILLDLRDGGRIFADGKLIHENGKFLIG
jgi:aminopeptidase